MSVQFACKLNVSHLPPYSVSRGQWGTQRIMFYVFLDFAVLLDKLTHSHSHMTDIMSPLFVTLAIRAGLRELEALGEALGEVNLVAPNEIEKLKINTKKYNYALY